MKILVVEDDPEIRTLIAYFLRKEKYEVEVCDNGLDALKMTTKFEPELIVLDLMLPNLDGISFTDMVRTMPEKYGKPFILMLTAKAEVEDVLKGLNIGADDYMKKPFDPRELLLRIKKILERNKKEEKSILNYREIEIDKEKYVLKEDERKKILTFIEKQDNVFIKIETNINQIARIANAQKFISWRTIERLLEWC